MRNYALLGNCCKFLLSCKCKGLIKLLTSLYTNRVPKLNMIYNSLAVKNVFSWVLNIAMQNCE